MVDLARADFMGNIAVARGYIALVIWTIHTLRLIIPHPRIVCKDHFHYNK